jgi:hypothetical protein
MPDPAPTTPLLSEARATTLRRMLLGVLAYAGVLLLAAIGTAIGGAERFALVAGVTGLLLAAPSGLALRDLPARGSAAQRWCIVTAVLLIVLAVPLVAVLVGLLMALAGVGLLFLLYAPEREGW